MGTNLSSVFWVHYAEVLLLGVLLLPTISTVLTTYPSCIPVEEKPRNSPYFDELTCEEQETWKFDRLTAVVEYVKKVQRNELERCAKPRDCAAPCPTRPRIALHEMFGEDITKVVYKDFLKYQRTALSIANLMNHIYQSADTSREFRSWFQQYSNGVNIAFQAFFYTLVRSVVESDPKIFGCMVALIDREEKGGFLPYAFRNKLSSLPGRVSNDIVVMDFVRQARYLKKQTVGFDWFHFHKNRSHSNVFRRPVGNIQTDPENLFPFSHKYLRKGPVYVVQEADGHWAAPVFECNKNKRWKFAYSLPFFNGAKKLKGVVALEFDLNDVDINQCRGDSYFYAKNICKQETTRCQHIPGRGFDTGSYNCKCKKGWYTENGSKYTGKEVQQQYLLKQQNLPNNYSLLNCKVCGAGCDSCNSEQQCTVEFDFIYKRSIPLAIQSFCITLCLVCGVIVFRLRRNRVIKTSVWILLEVFLFGAVILYATIVIMFFKPTHHACLLLPWFREIGFAVMYGTLTVKVYRVLSGFQSRKAHRVHVRDKDMLKYLGGIIAVAVGYMAAWTAVNMDYHEAVSRDPELSLMLQNGSTSDGKSFNVCRACYWDIVVELSEFFFLCLGLYYCYCVRSAPSDYSEIRYVTVAFLNETIMSAALHVARHFMWTTIHPDIVYLIYFLRCHLTVTVTVALIIGPKLWYVHRPPRDPAGQTRAYSQVDSGTSEAIKLNMTSNGDVEVAEVSLADMDSEDIRGELKRVYTQLEVYKTKMMRKDNPHVSKRRGGRKQTHRRFSIQAFAHHHKHRPAQSVAEEEVSKVSEDSTGSQEGAVAASATSPGSSGPGATNESSKL